MDFHTNLRASAEHSSQFCIFWTLVNLQYCKTTLMILSVRTDRSGQTVQTQVRLFLEEQSDQGLHCLQFPLHLLMLDSIVEPHCSNFRISTAVFRVSEYLGFLGNSYCKIPKYLYIYIYIHIVTIKFLNICVYIYSYHKKPKYSDTRKIE